MNCVLEQIQKTREYLDYIEEHYNNVQKAWNVAKEKWVKLPIIYDDFKFSVLDGNIKLHDDSKLSEHELVQYRRYFYPTNYEEHYAGKHFSKYGFNKAWEHHKKANGHHHNSEMIFGFYQEVYIAEMVLDWIAMGYKFGDTAKQFYEKEKMEYFDEGMHEYTKRLIDLFYG